MPLRHVPLLLLGLIAFLVQPTPSAAQGTSAERATGSEVTNGETGPCSGAEKIEPGEPTATNPDGVGVTNAAGSSGNANMNPASGCGGAGATTAVNTQTGFEGSITGLDANDTANLGSSNEATVSGNGGNVVLSGGSTVTVSNGNGGGNMTVTLPSGAKATVLPGSSVIFKT